MLRLVVAKLSVAVPVLFTGLFTGSLGCDPVKPDIDEPAAQVVNVDDIDDDGVRNAIDEDIDGDGVPNIQDDDVDGDGVSNTNEANDQDDATNPYGDSPNQEGSQGDVDGDGVPNNLDNDDDGDGVSDGVVGDNECNGVVVTDENLDCDGFCLDLETGLYACNDGAPEGSGVPDSDGDGIPDPLDGDDDGDGIPDGDDGNGGGLDPVTPVDPEDPVVPAECTNTQFTTGDDLLNPRVLLVIDKSGSMDQPDSSGQRKWDAARNALNGVVQSLNESIEFGLMLYPNGDSNSDACREGVLREGVEPTNANDIVNTLNNTEPGGGTPTAVTLGEAKSVLDGLPADGGGRAIILATDGGPNCNESLNGDTCRCVAANAADCQGNAGNCLDDANTISAAAQLNAAGYPVFVVGIDGTEAFTDVLNALASAGGTAQAGATAFYGVDDQAQLESAIEDIAIRIGVCRFDLPANFSAAQVTVTVNANVVARDTTRVNGWDQVDPNTIELFGVPCADAVDGGGGATVVDIQVCAG